MKMIQNKKTGTGKKLTAIMALVVMITLLAPGFSFAAKKVTLDVSSQRNVQTLGQKTGSTKERSLNDKAMSYQIPSGWEEVESRLTNIEGYCYKLNEISQHTKTDAEHLFLFYFNNEKYLLSQTDAGNREGIEKAIIRNIFPNVTLPRVNLPLLGFPTARIGRDEAFTWPEYDYYDTSYKDKNGKIHNAEFVFLQNGTKGMCCALYIYTESVHKEDIVTLLRGIETK